jgi:hypothetical protein
LNCVLRMGNKDKQRASGSVPTIAFGWKKCIVCFIQLNFWKAYDICSTRTHSVENSLWKRLWTCRKTDNRTGNLPENLHTWPQSFIQPHFAILYRQITEGRWFDSR